MIGGACRLDRVMKKILTIILCALLVVVVGVFLLVTIPKRVNVTWTEADLTSYLAKGKVNFNENRASVEDILTGDFVAVGVSVVNGTVTNAEASAIANAASKEAGFLKDIRIKFGDDGTVEASAQIGDNIDILISRFPEASKYKTYIDMVKGKTVYVKTTLERVGNKKFEAMIEQASIGRIPLPVGQLNGYMEQVGTEINATLARMSGFSAEEFSFDASGLNFKGSIPSELRSTK